MYRNRYQARGYAKKLKHKRYVKNRFGRRGNTAYGYYGFASWEDYIANRDKYFDEPDDKVPWSLRYWKRYYFSGRRKFAKRYTNRVIRVRNRVIPVTEEELTSRGATYRKEFDYNWTIW